MTIIEETISFDSSNGHPTQNWPTVNSQSQEKHATNENSVTWLGDHKSDQSTNFPNPSTGGSTLSSQSG